MDAFAAVLSRVDGRWDAAEVSIEDCESVSDFADLVRDVEGEVRLLLIEQDDEFAVIVRVDDSEQDPRAFLSDGHAADEYPLAAIFADELVEIGGEDVDEELISDTAPVHDSAPFGDANVVEDLGTSPTELLALAAHEGTLPIDILTAVCEKAGCGDQLDDLRA